MGSGPPPIISPNIRLRYPDHLEVGPGSIIDDYCYISARVRVGVGSHIASSCTIAGGPQHQFAIGDFSSLSAGVRVWCSSNDYLRDIVAINPAGLTDEELGVDPIEGDVILDHYTGVGANAVIMPANRIPIGVAIGALSFVPARFAFEPWTVYAGTPIRKVAARDRDRILAQVERARAEF